MPDIKPITSDGVPAALQKAHRYRLLNDSLAAESICLDVLAVDPGNVDAIVTWVLAITDQFPEGHADDLRRAGEAVSRLSDAYRHAYYQGIISERWAKAILHHGPPRAEEMAFDWVETALGWYEKAESMRPAGNDEAILRWNTCVRMLERHPGMRPRHEVETPGPSLE